jgi:tetratricopeptide (TPR) repeat protein
LNNLGTAWSTLSDARQAVSFYQRALAIYEQVYAAKPDHPDIAGVLNNLGICWRDLGDLEKAWSYIKRSQEISG